MRWGIVVLCLLFAGCIQEKRVRESTPASRNVTGSAYCFVAGVEIQGNVIPMEGCTPSLKLCRRAQWTAERYGGYANITWLSRCTFIFRDIRPSTASIGLRDCGISVTREDEMGNAIMGAIVWKKRHNLHRPCR
jgi:hypothetical protein